jgi:anti-sigma regulatory factor (Ser/Thr protein kinase)
VAVDSPMTVAEPRDHVVQIYNREEELIERVGSYLVEALQGDSLAIVVATADHRSAFQAWMAAHGVDPAAAEAAGLLFVQDARELLDRFMVDDQPDAGIFDEVIGGLVRQAASSGQAVYVYGEMVALLWEAGHVNAAIALETLWNELGGQVSFTLFCAYPAGLVGEDDDAGALRAVCSLHSDIVRTRPIAGVAGETTTLMGVFPWTSHSPSHARHFVVRALEEWGAERELVDDAALVVTELTTNALLHAQSASTVKLSVSREAVCISVADSALTLPQPRMPQPFECSGRGLGLIAAVADRWGAEPVREGKVVWAELRP